MVSNDIVIFSIDGKINSKNGGERINDRGEKVSLDEALNRLGFGRIHLLVVLAGGLTLLTVINETMGIGMLMPAAECDLQLSSSDKGLLSAISFLGIMVSSHFWGYLADTRGRRKMIIATLYSTAIITILSSVAHNFTLFVVLRFLSGVSISGPSATIYAYLGEFTGLRYRDPVIAFTSTFVGVSAAFVPGLAWIMLPQTWYFEIFDGLIFKPWRLQLILHTVPGIIAALLITFLPESPKFLVSQGRTDEALGVVRWIHKRNSSEKASSEIRISEIDAEIPAKNTNGGCFSSVWNQMKPLVSKPYLLHFFLFCCLQFGVFYVCAGVGLWFPHIVNQILLKSSDESQTLCQKFDFQPNQTHLEIFEDSCDDSIDTNTFLYNFLYGLLYILGYIILGFLIKICGRRVLLVALFGGSAVFGLGLIWLQHDTLMILFLALHVLCGGVTISVINSFVVAFFPTHLRATAMCITLLFGRVGTFAGSNIVGLLFDINCSLTFFISVGLISLCGVASLFLKTRSS